MGDFDRAHGKLFRVLRSGLPTGHQLGHRLLDRAGDRAVGGEPALAGLDGLEKAVSRRLSAFSPRRPNKASPMGAKSTLYSQR